MEKERPGELKAGECHLCAWEDDGSDPPGWHARSHEEWGDNEQYFCIDLKNKNKNNKKKTSGEVFISYSFNLSSVQCTHIKMF